MKRTKEIWEVRKNRLIKDGSQLGILAKLSDKPSEGGYRIVVGRNDIGKGYILDEADAQLIAAAPDLLEACRSFLNDVVNMSNRALFNNESRAFVNRNVERFQEVIAKAETVLF